MNRAPHRFIATLVVAAAVAACADAPSTAVRPPARVIGRIGFAPVFSAAARATFAKLPDFGISFDHVRIVIVRPPADTVKDTTIAFAPGQTDVTLELAVDIRQDGESFLAAIDYTNPTGVVFHGEGTVQSHAAGEPAPPQQITVQYSGPGATVTRVAVSPKSTTVVAPATVNFTATGFDANNAAIAGTPFNWTTSDATIATISNTGLLTPTGARGTVTVTATTPSNASDNATLTVSLPASGITLVSGGGQTGKAGTPLPLPGVVRVVARDGVGVAGVQVNFAAPTGGRVGSASVTTDANGTASTSLTLGGALGPQSFAASAAGFSVSIPATATAGDAATIAVVSGGGQSDTVKRPLKLPLVVKVSDAFGNPSSGVTVSWTRTAGAGALATSTSVTNTEGLATNSYTLGTVAGSETIAATVPGATASFSATALAGAASSIVIVSGNGQAARIQQALAPFVVKVTDEDGNPVGNATVTWTATNGTLSASSTTTDAAGQTSTTMTVGSTIGAAQATATIAGKSVTFSTVVQTGIVARIQFRTPPPASAPAGAPFAPPVEIALQDAGGNLTPATNPVTIALGANPNGGTLTGTLTRNAVGGIATFDDLVLDRAGAGYTLVASSAGVASVTSPAFTIVAGTAGSLVIVAGDGQTGTVNTAATVRPSVKLLDRNGNPIAGAVVTFAPTTGSGTVVPSTVTTDAAGIATLTSWTFGTASGPQSLIVSSNGVANVTIRATVQPGAPARYIVTATPTTQAAGGTSSVTAQLVDAFDNIIPAAGRIVNWTSTGGGAFATPSNATDANGATPPMAFTTSTTSGVTHTLTATDAASSSVTGSAAVTTVPGNAGRLAIVTQPSAAAQSRIPFAVQPVIQLQDANGNPSPQSGVTVTVSIASGGGTLGGTTTAVTDAAGRATFVNLSISGTVGPRTLGFAANGLVGVTSNTITLAAGAASRLAYSVNPTTTTAESPITPSIVVNVLDADGNTATTANNSVTLGITAGTGAANATLSGTTSVAAVNGSATFAGLSIATAGTGYTLTATSSGLTSATSAAFNITAGAPNNLVILAGNGQTGTAGANASIPPSVRLVDRVGNPIAGASVTFTPASGSGSVTPATAIATDANGIATLSSWTFGSVAGSQSLIVSSANVPNVTISATVAAGAAARLAILTQPSATAQNRVAFATQPVAQLQDASGNPKSQSGVTVAVAIGSGGGTLGGNLSAVTDTAGRAVFTNLAITGVVGPRTLSFTSAGLTAATSNTITVSAGAATRLAFTVNPSNTAAGSPIAPSVQVAIQDADGNTVTTASNSVSLAITTGTGAAGAVLSGTTTVNAASGIATFPGISIAAAGTGYSLTSTSAGLTAAVSTAFDVVAAAPTRLVIVTQPSATAQSGVAFAAQPILQLQDANGNASTQSGVTVNAGIATGGGTLGGTASVVTDAAGRASFTNLNVTGAAGQRTLSFTSNGLTGVTSNAINVTAGAPSRLAFNVNPTNTPAGVAITPAIQVTVQDAAGNTVTTATNAVSIAVTTGTGSANAQLAGTTTVAPVNGVATFADLSITPSATGYTLTATAATLTSAVSAAFNVTASLSAIAPTLVDAVFSTVPVTLTGSGFVIGGTTVAASGGNITPSNVAVQNGTTLTSDFAIAGGAATSAVNVTVATAAGTSNAAVLSLYSVGAAPVQLGAAHGGGGGTAYSLDCPVGAVATGLNAAGGANVDRFQIICQTVTGAARTFGAATLTATAGGSGGEGGALSCPAAYVMTGLTGRIGNGGSGLNDQIGAICSPIGGGAPVTTGTIGSAQSGSVAYSESCPVGLVLTGIQGGAGNLVDRTQIKCR